MVCNTALALWTSGLRPSSDILSRQATVVRSVYFVRGLRPRSLLFCFICWYHFYSAPWLYGAVRTSPSSETDAHSSVTLHAHADLLSQRGKEICLHWTRGELRFWERKPLLDRTKCRDQAKALLVLQIGTENTPVRQTELAVISDP
jgi:hypothetical protein